MRRLIAILVVALVAPVAADHGAPTWEDPAVALGLFPSHDEVQTRIDAIDHPFITVHEIGTTTENRTLRLLEITQPGDRTGRVVTFLMTQQHGNEPAGTPAAMRLLDRIEAGEFDNLLQNQVLLLLPMTNPDGATVNDRENAENVDINRDHVHLGTPEAKAVHKVLRDWNVHVAIDHHEYSGTGFGEPVPVRTYDWDLTMMHPRHGNVHPTVMDLSKELMYDHIFPHANENGFSTGDYGMVTVHGVPVNQVAGGPDPGILRNNFGLNNVVGLLAESFVNPGNPFQDAERRTRIHEVTMEATLQFAHENAARLVEAKAAVEDDFVANPPSLYVEGETEASFYDTMKTQDDLTDLMFLHGLPGHTEKGGEYYHALNHTKPGLAAAILHPASSRAVTDAEPAVLTTVTTVYHPAQSANVPAPAVALLVAALIGLVALRRR